MIRIFLHQPVDNETLVILDIIVTLITCKSIVLVNFNEQKLSNSKKTQEKLTDKHSYLPYFAYHVQSSSLCRTVQTQTYLFRYYR